MIEKKNKVQILSPIEGQVIQREALTVKWRNISSGVKAYKLQFSRTENFEEYIERKVNQFPADVTVWFPEREEDFLEEGKWYCRISWEDNGEICCSLPVSFVIAESLSFQEVNYKLSPHHPLIIFYSPGTENLASLWKIVPEDLKHLVAIRITPAEEGKGDEVIGLINKAVQTGANIIIQGSGPHYVKDGKFKVVTLTEIEYCFQKWNNIIGVIVVEQYLGSAEEHNWRREYFKRLLKLCAKYGRLCIYSDGNRNYFEWPLICLDEQLLNYIISHKDYFIPVWKMNHSLSAIITHTSILGLWISGVCNNFGIQPEHWYWNDAGFRQTHKSYGYLQGIEHQIPSSFVGQMILLGVVSGATVYSFEGAFWLIEKITPEVIEWSKAGKFVIGLFKYLLQNKFILQKKEVIEKVKLAIMVKNKQLGDPFDFGIFRGLVNKVYGINESYEIIPKKFDFYYVPIVSHLIEKELRKINIPVIDIEKIDKYFREEDKIFARKTNEVTVYWWEKGELLVAMNPHEKEGCYEVFERELNSELEENRFILERMRVVFPPYAYFLLKRINDVYWIHLGIREDNSVTFYFKLSHAAEINWTNGELISKDEDELSNTYKFIIKSEGEPINILIVKKGSVNYSKIVNLPQEKAKTNNREIVFLSDLPWSEIFIKGSKNPCKDISCISMEYGKHPIKINEIVYRKGISFPIGASVKWNLKRRFKEFRAVIGIDDGVWFPIIRTREEIIWDRPVKDVKVRVRILGDRKILWDSGLITSSETVKEICLEVREIDEFVVLVEGEELSRNDYVDLGGAYFTV